MSAREHEIMLGAMASAAERRNKPVALVAFGAALLAGAFAFYGWNAGQARSARAAFEREAQAAQKVGMIADRIVFERENAAVAGETDYYAPNPTLLSALASSATGAGLTKTPAFTQNTEDSGGPIVRKTVTARISAEAVETTLAWVERALGEVDGLHVASFSLKSTRATGWEVEVRFARWETKEAPAR